MDRERRYHHGDLRATLIAAAIGEIESVGVDHLSLRSLAHEVGVSPSAAYHHFADKDALISAVALRAFELLDQSVLDAVQALPSGTPAVTRLGAAASAYIAFASDHEHLFRVAFSGHRPQSTATEHPLLAQLLDDIVDSGSAPAALRAGADAVVWATIHGIATLVIEGYFDPADVPTHIAVLERTMRIGELTGA